MIQVDSQASLNAELSKSNRVLAIFYATWCPYCMRFVPLFRDQVSSRGFSHVVEVILDDYDNPLWDEYGVAAVPTIILFEGGKILSRLDGRLGRGLSEEQFLGWIKNQPPT